MNLIVRDWASDAEVANAMESPAKSASIGFNLANIISLMRGLERFRDAP